MTRTQLRRRVGWAIALVFLVLVAVSLGAPPGLMVRGGAYVLAAGVVEALVMSLGPLAPRPRQSPFDKVAHARPVEAPAPPEALERLRREAWLATQSSGGWHFRLRPPMREIASAVLEDRHGITLDDDSEAASAVLGPEAWALLRPDATPPDDRWTTGISPEDLDRLIRRMEDL